MKSNCITGCTIGYSITKLYIICRKVRVSDMGTSWVVTILGVIVSLLGWYMTPIAWGYGILGFGLAFIVLGILGMFREPERSR
jgi:hypothetical protein